MEKSSHNVDDTTIETVSHFMNRIIFDYYAQGDVFGGKGDFITSPEISQVFGEMIAVWWIDVWRRIYGAQEFHFVELGAGRGTLMEDILRTGEKMNFVSQGTFHIVEQSKALEMCQKNRLSNRQCFWYESLDSLKSVLEGQPHKPLFLLANEFFDALPIDQYCYQDKQWYQRHVVSRASVFNFQWIPMDETDVPIFLRERAQNDGIWEYPTGSDRILSLLCPLIRQYKGTFLCFDYGYLKAQVGETLQAVYRHQYCGIFENLGRADLSAHVNFECLFYKAGLENIFVSPCMSQGKFLESLGARRRFSQLMQVQPEHAENLLQAQKRLMHRDSMGELFKVFVMSFQKYSLPGLEAFVYN